MAIRSFGKRIPELDGLRGMAILMVLIYHGVVDKGARALFPAKVEALLTFGWSGVDLFFVLSGFLIGGILLDVKEAGNFFKVFYVRRFYRILPLYFVLCASCVLLYHVPLSTHDWLYRGKIPWYAFLTFGQNFWMAHYSNGANGNTGAILGVTWSLAVEEQFYLTLPLFIRNFSRRTLIYILGFGVLLAPLLRILLWFTLSPQHRIISIYVLAPCRMGSLLMGVLGACAVRNETSLNWLTNNKRVIGAVSALLGLGILEMVHAKVRMGSGSFALISFGYTLIALFYLSILLLAVTQKGLVHRFFALRPLTELGILAYGVYLFHEMVAGLVFAAAKQLVPGFETFQAVSLTLLSWCIVIICAKLSWVYFEKPLVNRGHRYKYCHQPPANTASLADSLKTTQLPAS